GGLSDDNAVRQFSGLSKPVLKNVATRRVRAWHKDVPNAMAPITMPECLQRIGDCRWMMAEVVDHSHPARFAAYFQPPRDAGKTLEGVVDLRFWHIIKSRCCRRHCRVAHIKFADKRNFESLPAKFESCTFGGVGHVSNSLGAILRETDLDHLRQTIFRDLHAIGVVAVQ